MSRPMTRTLLPFAVALALLPGLAGAEDLLQAYQQARDSDPVLAQAGAQQRATQEGITQARALLLPQIAASYSYSKSHGTSSSTQPFSTNTGFQIFNFTSSSSNYGTTLQGTLSQTLFDFSKWANYKASKAQAASQDASYESQAQNLYLRVATAYFAVLTARDQLSFAKSNEKALASQLDQAQQRFNVGLAAITDVNQAKAQHDAAVATVISSRNALDDAREALTQITGKPATDLRILRNDIPMVPPTPSDQEAWVNQALAQNPALLAQQQQVRSANDSISAARAGHLPTLSAQLTYTRAPGWGDQTSRLGGIGAYHTNNMSRDTAIGVVLSVPIFSGGATQSRVRQAIDQRDEQQDVLEQDRRALVRNTRNAYRSIIAGISSVEANQQAVISARSSLEATQAGYEVGTQTIVDVLLAQQTLFQAESAYSQARHALVINQLALKADAGTLDYKDLEQVNALLK